MRSNHPAPLSSSSSTNPMSEETPSSHPKSKHTTDSHPSSKNVSRVWGRFTLQWLKLITPGNVVDLFVASPLKQRWAKYQSCASNFDIYSDYFSQHPLVRVHPVTGEKALYINQGFTRRIVGFKDEESEWLLKFLFDHISKGADFIVRATYEPGTVVVWVGLFLLLSLCHCLMISTSRTTESLFTLPLRTSRRPFEGTLSDWLLKLRFPSLPHLKSYDHHQPSSFMSLYDIFWVPNCIGRNGAIRCCIIEIAMLPINYEWPSQCEKRWKTLLSFTWRCRYK